MVDSCCNFCGALIGGTHAWSKEFRAIYINGHQWSVSTLSGVGHRGNPQHEVYAPQEVSARYDDFNYSQANAVWVVCSAPMYAEDNVSSPEPNEEPLEACSWGYIVHAACWKLLQEACYPHDIDLNTLMRIFRSLPTGPVAVNWGHDYGGLFELKYSPRDVHLGGPNFMLQYSITSAPSSPYEISHIDPLDIPWLRKQLSKMIKQRPPEYDTSSLCARYSTLGTDCFERLPCEIRDLVLCYLPSTDVRNLRVSSRVFARVLLSQTFWESRFHRGKEFDYIFDAYQDQLFDSKNFYRNWRSLYTALKDVGQGMPLGLLNRKRIWKLLQPLADALSKLSGLEPEGEPYATFWEPHLKPNSSTCWRSVSAYITDSKKWFHAGCRTLFIREVKICPSEITGVYTAMISFYDHEYITGLRFHHKHRKSVDLGYIPRHSEKSILLDLVGCGRVCGFHVALGFQGIHALAVAMSDTSSSKWAGNPEGLNMKSISSKSGSISSVKAHFDGFKMISLGIPKD